MGLMRISIRAVSPFHILSIYFLRGSDVCRRSLIGCYYSLLSGDLRDYLILPPSATDVETGIQRLG